MNKTYIEVLTGAVTTAALQLITLFAFVEVVSLVITFFTPVPDTKFVIKFVELAGVLYMHVYRLRIMTPAERDLFSSRFVQFCALIPLAAAAVLLVFGVHGLTFVSLLFASLFFFKYQLFVHKQRGASFRSKS
ncbi:hypothetical protein A3C89_00910 [Candidatus Kaiserbacteria bacterium RIFCSPHIGHO2_02_FULL_50_50]|uniref:Uncharacterized protein n=1 Tax=Candidatus Kaiserbacteria bacterium RIFCSPHIGHO2_02_FULL_50_50 TaxID=1798492 RepID=A0A1F6DFX9_9BACT|nr:MAG: hypothetical protein A3C89_00910 [Candidatus Kaiserbacteria bacterium RIFCSPHIGHO2_02_FULL_50_50]OGG88923.1 MAG: hypothetical protein A3G62_02785 [Candidatus Kaiserbacteria bacterium RIFCSPLOWO2_12_FULL_50_10]